MENHTRVFGRIRRKLREIDYHSARRPSSKWSRVSDWWLFLSLPAAILITALVGWLTRTNTVNVIAIGVLWKDSQSQLVAQFAKPGGRLPGLGDFVAGVDLREERFGAGWPIAMVDRVTLTILMSDGARTTSLDFSGPAAEEQAIRAAIERFDPKVASAFATQSRVEVNYGSIVGAAAALWIALLPLGLLVILFARFASAYLAARGTLRRAVRERRNLCPKCGYSLIGIEFSSRCPECGDVLI